MNVKKILLYIFQHFKESEFQTLTASLSFITIVSIIPLAGISITFFHLTGQLESVYGQVEPLILKYFADSASDEVLNIIKTMLSQIKSVEVGLTAFIGFFFTSTSLIQEIDKSFQQIWKRKRKQSFLIRMSVYWLILFLSPIIFIFILSIIVHQDFSLPIPISLSALVFVLIGLFIVYKFTPPIKIRNQVAIISALLTSITFFISQKIYFELMVTILRKNQVYGSFISIPVFLMYVYLLWMIFLSGAIFCAGLQKGFDNIKIKK